MKILNFSVMIMLWVMFFGACKKSNDLDILSTSGEPNIQAREQKTGFREQIDLFMKDHPEYKPYGQLDFESAIHYETDNFGLYSIPFRKIASDSVEHSFFAVDFKCGNNGIYVAINDRTAYQFLMDKNLYGDDELVQAHVKSTLDDFATFNSKKGDTSVDNRTEKKIIIEFENGEIWEINMETGVITVISSGSSSNCFGTGWVMTFWNGKKFYSDGSSSGGSSGFFNGWKMNGPTYWNHDGNSGDNSGGGATYGSPFNCQDGVAFWSTVPAKEKKKVLNAVDNLYDLYNLKVCVEPNDKDCVSFQDLVCTGVSGGCFQLVNGEFDESHFNSCMGEELAGVEYPAISTECSINAEFYILSNGLSVTPEELSYVLGGFGNTCGDKDAFSKYVNNRLQELDVRVKLLKIELGFDDDVAAYLLANAPSGCDGECLTEMVNDYLTVQGWIDDGTLTNTFEIPYDPSRSVVSSANQICPEMFDFVQQYPLTATVATEASGIRNLIVEINQNGQLRHYKFNNFVFKVWVDCPESEQFAAQAINDGIACASQRFSDNNLFVGGMNHETNAPMTAIDIRNATVMICIYKAFGVLMNSNPCNPGTTQGNTTTTVKFDVKSVSQYYADQNYDVNTFKLFSTFDSTCN